MKTGKNITAFSIVILLTIGITVFGQDNLISKSKTIEKIYLETPIKSVDIFNAFGNVNISRWNESKLKVSVTVNVIAWDDDDAQRFIEKILPEMNFEKEKTGFYHFNAATNLSNIRNLCNCKEEGIVYAPWFKKNAKVKQYSVNYDIKIPASTDILDIGNNFGNVSLPDYNGKLILTLKNGNLKAGKLELNNSNEPFRVRYGNVAIESIENSNLCLYSCKDVKIGDAENITLSSQFSTIEINDCSELSVKSKNDKITINNCTGITGTGNFTDLHIKELSKILIFNNKSGSVEIDKIASGFNTISLDGQFNDYVLNMDDKGYIINAEFEFTDFEGPEEILPVSKRKELITGHESIEKKIGNNSSKSLVTLKCSNCNVELK